MDPSIKHWLRVYTATLKKHVWQQHALLCQRFGAYRSLEEFIHAYIHSSGLFYAHVKSLTLVEFESMNTWTYADLFKISFTEGFFLAYFFYRKQEFESIENVDDLIDDGHQKLYEFYLLYAIKDSYFKKNKEVLRTANKDYLTVESIINHRVNDANILQRKFWRGSQFHIFSYLDILFFAYWLQGEYIYEQREDIKQFIVKTMMFSSRYSDLDFEKKRVLLSYFLISGNFDADTELTLGVMLSYGIDSEELEPINLIPHEFKRIVLEYSLLALFNDSSMLSSQNQEFLKDFLLVVNMSSEVVERSVELVTQFVGLHYNHLLYFNTQEGLDAVTKNVSRRFSFFIIKNKAKIISEISESRELVELLWKSKHEKLTDEEREKIKEQIIDLLKTLPSLAIFMIPGGSFLLPILFKILPENLLTPSSFRNK